MFQAVLMSNTMEYYCKAKGEQVLVTKNLEWKNDLPNEEGIYLIDDNSGKERMVRIANLKMDNTSDRPDNFHVIEDNDYFSLSIENGCLEWKWAKV